MVRHGRTVFNREGRITGRVDVPLDPVGLAEARRVGALMAAERFDLCFTSELLRARQTLEQILAVNAHRLKPVFQPAEAICGWPGAATRDSGRRVWALTSAQLNERDFGVLEGQPRAAHLKTICDWDAVIEGAEPLHDVWQRVTDFYERRVLPCFAAGGSLLLVAHGMVLRLLRAHIECADKKKAPAARLDNCAVLVCENGDASRPGRCSRLGGAAEEP